MKTPENVTDIKVGCKKQKSCFSEDLKKNIRSTIERIRYFGVGWGAGDYVDVEDLENICDYAEDMIGLIEDMNSRLAQVERERDAALKDIANTCWSCGNAKPHQISKFLYSCPHLKGKAGVRTQCEHWQWSGIRPENTKEDET